MMVWQEEMEVEVGGAMVVLVVVLIVLFLFLVVFIGVVKGPLCVHRRHPFRIGGQVVVARGRGRRVSLS